MLAALWAVLLFVLLMSSVSSPFVQNIAVPSYFEPGPEWTQMQNDYPTVELAIVNPSSGPGEIANPAFAREVRQTQAAGLTVLGYVHTGYGERSKAAVEKDVEKYYSWYGVDGIFFDEASTDCQYATS
ncbi:MAG: spherulation-specific family 4 protein, partial [Actinomycetota bacterium]|nr:spherulation-specific family 4 protein [Actinomycetota bacterium]